MTAIFGQVFIMVAFFLTGYVLYKAAKLRTQQALICFAYLCFLSFDVIQDIFCPVHGGLPAGKEHAAACVCCADSCACYCITTYQ